MAIDYLEALDAFLRVPTWHTPHPLDNRRFFKALDNVVSEPDFNPDAMGHEIRAWLGPIASEAHSHRIDRLVQNAWAVREYLEAQRH